MRARSLLILTAIVSSLLGAVVVWLVLTVPNDLQAGALLRAARKDVAAGNNDKARQELSRIIQQYPRTDAAAAATVALATIADSERQEVKDRLRQNTDRAVERGVFGAPTFFVGNEIFWGNDRFDFVEETLRKLV